MDGSAVALSAFTTRLPVLLTVHTSEKQRNIELSVVSPLPGSQSGAGTIAALSSLAFGCNLLSLETVQSSILINLSVR